MSAPNQLKRELGTVGATFMGFGAMLGTGVFVSIGIAAGAGGPSVILAIFVAALVALCNALSSAQLAASHPVSGGAYEYGYIFLRPDAGFAAGWMFLCAKSASAASAALGASGYLLHASGFGENIDVRWPAAALVVLATSALLYIAVGLVAIGAAGSADFAASTERFASPLESVLRGLDHPLTATLVAAGAVTAMLGVLLNLILGLSRVALAMARRRDLPHPLATVKNGSPRSAVLATGVLVLALTLIGDIRLTWAFSAFTVLVYYAINNLCALRQPAGQRLYPRAFAWVGLVACVFLAFWVEPRVWMIGLLVLVLGLIGHFLVRRHNSSS